ncbi:MAG: hypothetical protein ACI4E1_06550 [Lachnospira sp.]
MSDINFRKQLLLNEFKTLSKGKSNDEMLPLVLAVSQKAKQAGIVFDKKDMDIILSDLRPNMTQKEQQLLEQMLLIMSS